MHTHDMLAFTLVACAATAVRAEVVFSRPVDPSSSLGFLASATPGQRLAVGFDTPGAALVSDMTWWGHWSSSTGLTGFRVSILADDGDASSTEGPTTGPGTVLYAHDFTLAELALTPTRVVGFEQEYRLDVALGDGVLFAGQQRTWVMIGSLQSSGLGAAWSAGVPGGVPNASASDSFGPDWWVYAPRNDIAPAIELRGVIPAPASLFLAVPALATAIRRRRSPLRPGVH